MNVLIKGGGTHAPNNKIAHYTMGFILGQVCVSPVFGVCPSCLGPTSVGWCVVWGGVGTMSGWSTETGLVTGKSGATIAPLSSVAPPNLEVIRLTILVEVYMLQEVF